MSLPASLPQKPMVDYSGNVRASSLPGKPQTSASSHGIAKNVNLATSVINSEELSLASTSATASTGAGKRKSITSPSPKTEKSKRKRSNDNEKEKQKPNSILPTPLPSVRFRTRPGTKSFLIPVEQLPVYPLPALPVIQDPELREQVFTHISLYERQKGKFEEPESDPGKHYEKLEHVGDSILGMVVTTWLHEVKPLLTCGTATQLKAHIVSNATLSHLSGLYGLPQRLVAEPDSLPVLRAQTDVRAALMESYIAALYLSFPPEKRFSEALPIIDTWLRELYDPLFEFFLEYMKTEWSQHNGAVGAGEDGDVLLISEGEKKKIDNASMGMLKLVKLYCHNKKREFTLTATTYDTNVGELYSYKCSVDGIELGEGTRADRKMAKNVAAWEAAKKLGLTDDTVLA